jgi:hypothetical protein
MARLRRFGALMLLGALQLTAGCQHTLLSEGAAPEPVAAKPATGGLLLQTGAVQLGPGVGENAWRWQGDGKWGF